MAAAAPAGGPAAGPAEGPDEGPVEGPAEGLAERPAEISPGAAVAGVTPQDAQGAPRPSKGCSNGPVLASPRPTQDDAPDATGEERAPGDKQSTGGEPTGEARTAGGVQATGETPTGGEEQTTGIEPTRAEVLATGEALPTGEGQPTGEALPTDGGQPTGEAQLAGEPGQEPGASKTPRRSKGCSNTGPGFFGPAAEQHQNAMQEQAEEEGITSG